MASCTRRAFIVTAGMASAAGALVQPEAAATAASPTHPLLEASAASFRLSFSPGRGLEDLRLIHLPSGLRLAQGAYSYSFGPPQFQPSTRVDSSGAEQTIALRGTTENGLEILHDFRIPREQPWIEEEITITNRRSTPVDLHDGRCGFVLPLQLSNHEVLGPWSAFKFTAVPYRREPDGHRRQYADYSAGDVLTGQFSSELWTHQTTVTPAFASEGWAWTNGKLGFLITKYSQKGMEWALLDRVSLPGDQMGLRWGGFGIYRDDPEHGAWLLSGEQHRFGVTRLTAYQGGMLEGFYAFRDEMTSRGHGCPEGFDPPVHWNELYDNKLWWLPDEKQNDPEMRKKYYTLGDMKEEAAKAKAIGCEALYQDPGWDTSFASKIWDEARLGSYKAFTEMLKRDYGLKSSLHTPLSGWCDPSSYPSEMYRMDRFGQRLTWNKERGFNSSPLCGASQPYVEETARRLKKLAQDGATYFMFDGTMYHAECWDPKHGHQVPARREEHVQATSRLARMVHAGHPHVLIEMHDPMAGGDSIRVAPTYYGHGRAAPGEQVAEALGFDSVWAFELMWGPMEDLLTGHAIALYYYNLAFGLPLYIHIDLRKDNPNALEFWWNASTCRHLGIGGTHSDPQVQQAHKAAMVAYRRLKPFFAAGIFYGIDETTHLHRHPSQSAAVINCFNLDDHSATRHLELEPVRFDLDPKKEYEIKGAPGRRVGDRYIVDLEIPSYGHVLLEVV